MLIKLQAALKIGNTPSNYAHPLFHDADRKEKSKRRKTQSLKDHLLDLANSLIRLRSAL
jgi:hypothetical protein